MGFNAVAYKIQQSKLILFWCFVLLSLQQNHLLIKLKLLLQTFLVFCENLIQGDIQRAWVRVVKQSVHSGMSHRDVQNSHFSVHQTQCVSSLRKHLIFPAIAFLLTLCWDFWVFGKQGATPTELDSLYQAF